MILPKYPRQTQYCDEWCWAAVASSVALNYDPHTQWTQPALAAKFINSTCSIATSGHVPDVCQYTRDFIKVIKDPSVNTYGWDVSGLIPLSQFQTQIGSGWVVCCIVDFGTVQHVVAVVGFQDNVIIIDDPELDQRVPVDYDNFSQGYRGGSISRTIGTQPAA